MVHLSSLPSETWTESSWDTSTLERYWDQSFGADDGVELGAFIDGVLGRLDVGLADGEHDGPPVVTAFGYLDGEQLGHFEVGTILGPMVEAALD